MTSTARVSRNATVFAGALVLLGAALAGRATAQQGFGVRKGEAFGYLTLAAPTGDFGDRVGFGGGAGFGGVLFPGGNGLAGLRAEGSFIVYGSETLRVPLSPTVPFVDVDVRTTNSIVAAGLGPQVYLGSGPVRPYLYGTVGFAYFFTSTSIRGMYDDEPIASTTNFDDFQLALSGGGGLSVEIRGGRNPLSLDVSASYQHNGLTEYLANGADNLVQGRRGSWTANPIVGDANLLTYRAGVTVGIG